MECMQNSVSPSVMHFESNLILLFIIIKRQFRGFRDSDKRTLKGYFSSTWLGGACTGGGGGGWKMYRNAKCLTRVIPRDT